MPTDEHQDDNDLQDAPRWTPQPGKALALRSCHREEDGRITAHAGFEWPNRIGAVVTAPDWDERPRCGGGLHGLLWGTGQLGHLDTAGRDSTAYLVVEVDVEDVVHVGGDKIKFPVCTIVHIGTYVECVKLLHRHAPKRPDLTHDVARLSVYTHRTFARDISATGPGDYDDVMDDGRDCVEIEPGPLATIISSELAADAELPVPLPSLLGEDEDEPAPARGPLHTIALDVDMPVTVRESSTPGHFHLFIDCPPMPWRRYRKLLRALRDAGVIEPGYYSAAVARRATFLRLPWVRKSYRPDEPRTITDLEMSDGTFPMPWPAHPISLDVPAGGTE